MGWKKIKEHYGLPGLVFLRDGDLVIMDPSGDELVVTPKGETSIYPEQSPFLQRVRDAIKADTEKYIELWLAQDVFSASIPAFTFSYEGVHGEHCEVFELGQTTHEGTLMQAGTHYRTEEAAAMGAFTNLTHQFESRTLRRNAARVTLNTAEAALKVTFDGLTLLRTTHPEQFEAFLAKHQATFKGDPSWVGKQ